MKLNKSIKRHIVQMAIRSKFETEFKSRLENLTVELKSVVDVETKAYLFKGLDSHVISCLRKTNRINFPYRQDINLSDNVKVALGARYCLDRVILKDAYVYGHDHSYTLQDSPQCLKDFRSYCKEIETFAETIEGALACFKSAPKMFKELPWSEEFYPAEEKKPACNVVPVSTIAAANDLMGIK